MALLLLSIIPAIILIAAVTGALQHVGDGGLSSGAVMTTGIGLIVAVFFFVALNGLRQDYEDAHAPEAFASAPMEVASAPMEVAWAGVDCRDIVGNTINLGSDPIIDDIFANGGTVEVELDAVSGGWATVISKNKWSILKDGERDGFAKMRFGHRRSLIHGIWATTDFALELGVQHTITITYDASGEGFDSGVYPNSGVSDPVIYIDGEPVSVSKIQDPWGEPVSDADYDLVLCDYGDTMTAYAFQGVIYRVQTNGHLAYGDGS